MKLIECPRDAMQGLQEFIPTTEKIAYINKLLSVGFDTVDFGSFVSPKAIPQMRDTAEVVEQLEWRKSKTSLLAIVANTRGAEEAAKYEAITYLGFPLSISETFQERNTNKSISQALDTLNEIQNICVKHDKKLVSYISMGFGNPYNDPYSEDLVVQFTDILRTLGSSVVSLADTVGVSKPEQIQKLFSSLTSSFPDLEIGVHLHSRPETAVEKIAAAYNSGCRRFDGAIMGFGGCPMANDDLVGNIATEKILEWLKSINIESGLNIERFNEARIMANRVFPH